MTGEEQEAAVSLPKRPLTFWEKLSSLGGTSLPGPERYYDRLVKSANDSLSVSDHARAKKLAGIVVRQLAFSQERLSLKHREILGRALLVEAAVSLEERAVAEAVGRLREAGVLGQSAPHQWCQVALEMARNNDQTTGAIAVYLEALRACGTQNIPSDLQPAISILAYVCEVDEHVSQPAAEARLALNERVAGSAPQLAWPVRNIGLALYALGRFGEARARFEAALRSDPGDESLHYFGQLCEGQLYRSTGQLQLAVRAFEAAARTSPNSHQAPFLAAQVLCQHYDQLRKQAAPNAQQVDAALRGALQFARTAAAAVPDKADVLLLLGRLYNLLREYDRATEALTLALRAAPQDREVQWQLAMAHSQSGNHRDALRIVISIEAAEPQVSSDVRHVLLAAQIRLHAGRHEDALIAFNKVLSMASDTAEARTGAISALFSLGRFDELIRMQRDHPASDRESRLLFSRSLLKTKAVAAAETELAALLSAFPADGQVHYYKGLAAAHMGRHEDALGCLERALAAGASPDRVKLQIGHCHARLQRHSEALESYAAVLEKRPEDRDALLAMAAVATVAGADDSARAALARVKGDDHRVCLLRAWWAEKDGAPARALSEYGKAVAASPADPTAATRYATLLVTTGKFADAIKVLRIFHTTGAQVQDSVLFARGLANACSGEEDAARGDWQDLAARHPHDERLRLNLNRIDYMLGWRALERASLATAIKHWERFAEPRPEDSRARSDLVSVLLRHAAESMSTEGSDHQPAAERALARAEELDPENLDVAHLQGIRLLMCGDAASADRVLAEASRKTSDGLHISCLYHRALAIAEKGAIDAALVLLTEIDGDPKAPRVPLLHAKALCLATLGRYAEAADLLIDDAQNLRADAEA